MLKTIGKKILRRLYQKRSRQIIKKIHPHLSASSVKKIVDIGAGTCLIAEMLHEKGFSVFPIDIKNRSLTENIKPVIYDGKKIPCPDDSFDVAVIITVLHHTAKPEDIIREAKRVAKKIIIIEDIYDWTIKKYSDFAIDSLINFEFIGHPHTNKKDSEWKIVFKNLGLEMKKSFFWRSYFGFRHTFYWLEK